MTTSNGSSPCTERLVCVTGFHIVVSAHSGFDYGLERFELVLLMIGLYAHSKMTVQNTHNPVSALHF